jgi:hypothetical protein
MVWHIGPVNEYEAGSAIIPFVGIIIYKGYELQQQCCDKERKLNLADAKCAASTSTN